VGHVLYPEQGKLKIEDRDGFPLRPEDNRQFTKEEVDEILRNDLARFERGVAQYCPVSLSQGQFDALVSFSFNVGLGTLQRSTLRQKILRGDAAEDEFLRYTIGGGKVLKGLVNRRNDERALYLG
jgi:lysozyme